MPILCDVCSEECLVEKRVIQCRGQCGSVAHPWCLQFGRPWRCAGCVEVTAVAAESEEEVLSVQRPSAERRREQRCPAEFLEWLTQAGEGFKSRVASHCEDFVTRVRRTHQDVNYVYKNTDKYSAEVINKTHRIGTETRQLLGIMLEDHDELRTKTFQLHNKTARIRTEFLKMDFRPEESWDFKNLQIDV